MDELMLPKRVHVGGGQGRSLLSQPAWRWAANVALLMLLASCGWGLFTVLDRPITVVRVQGANDAQEQREIEIAVARQLGPGILSTDVAEVAEQLRSIDWTRGISVRRVWPDQLDVHIQRATPIAHWNRGFLLGQDGRVYRALGAVDAHLPHLSGPEGSAREVIEHYEVLRDIAAKAGLKVTRIALDERGEWSIELDGVLTALLGRDDVLVRARRVASLYSRHLADRRADIARIDARYANGVAVAWRESQAAISSQLASK